MRVEDRVLEKRRRPGYADRQVGVEAPGGTVDGRRLAG
jgi:hypothetical protein